MAFNKKAARLRRSRQTRLRIKDSGNPRLSVFRSSKHIYAQLVSADGSKVIACASTLQAELKAELTKTTDVTAAALVGRFIAKRAQECGISSVAFDRSGYKYHGRVRALAESARDAGLKF